MKLTPKEREYGEYVASVLNHEADVKGQHYERFAKLTENLLELSTLVGQSKGTRLIDAEFPFVASSEREQSIADAIEAELQSWPMQPRLRWDPDRRLKISIDPMLRPEVFRKVSFDTFRAFSALFVIVDFLDKLTKCEHCRKWMFVRVSTGDRRQRRCDECHRSEDAEYKRVQRLYQKHKYRNPNFDGTDFHSNKVCKAYLRTRKCEICQKAQKEVRESGNLQAR